MSLFIVQDSQTFTIPANSAGRRDSRQLGGQLKKAVVKTLAYSAVFNFPLKKEEIWKYLIVGNVVMPFMASTIYGAINCTTTIPALQDLQEKGLVEERSGYYFLMGMESSVIQRIKRKGIAQKKLSIGKKFCKIAKYIPTIKLIGISGALAMNNAHEDDDIDLFIIAKSGTVWITRFLTALLAEIMGVRRRPKGNNVKDKICLNMFVDEENMRIPENERDLFSAHEVVQMKPIYDRDNTYGRFLRANEWVRKYMPNSIDSRFTIHDSRFKKSRVTCYVLRVTAFIEQLVKKIQLKYMQSRHTNEVISDGYLRFHPSDARKFVIRRYRQILSIIEVNINE
jgi:D-beta-D-heptose 7-phosphate kinase/D-beta-D-heptose 1-phosphate adenosyltransferase